ncbi:MAG: hypothetical protein KGH63_00070 [Candidatus Micrarchaeota archaeon]|nr:hypothetical protein [Candidatus Micrarchaeota archaeon]
MGSARVSPISEAREQLEPYVEALTWRGATVLRTLEHYYFNAADPLPEGASKFSFHTRLQYRDIGPKLDLVEPPPLVKDGLRFTIHNGRSAHTYVKSPEGVDATLRKNVAIDRERPLDFVMRADRQADWKLLNALAARPDLPQELASYLSRLREGAMEVERARKAVLDEVRSREPLGREQLKMLARLQQIGEEMQRAQEEERQLKALRTADWYGDAPGGWPVRGNGSAYAQWVLERRPDERMLSRVQQAGQLSNLVELRAEMNLRWALARDELDIYTTDLSKNWRTIGDLLGIALPDLPPGPSRIGEFLHSGRYRPRALVALVGALERAGWAKETPLRELGQALRARRPSVMRALMESDRNLREKARQIRTQVNSLGRPGPMTPDLLAGLASRMGREAALPGDREARRLWKLAKAGGFTAEAAEWTAYYLQWFAKTQTSMPWESPVKRLYAAWGALEEAGAQMREQMGEDPGRWTEGQKRWAGFERRARDLTDLADAYLSECERLAGWTDPRLSKGEGAFLFLHRLANLRSAYVQQVRQALYELDQLEYFGVASAEARRELIALKQSITWTDPVGERELMRQAARLWGEHWPAKASGQYLETAERRVEQLEAWRHKLHPPNGGPKTAKIRRHDGEELYRQTVEQLAVTNPTLARVLRDELAKKEEHPEYKFGTPERFSVRGIISAERQGLAAALRYEHEGLQAPEGGHIQANLFLLNDKLREANAAHFGTLRARAGEQFMKAHYAPDGDVRLHHKDRAPYYKVVADREWFAQGYSQKTTALDALVRERTPIHPLGGGEGLELIVWDPLRADARFVFDFQPLHEPAPITLARPSRVELMYGHKVGQDDLAEATGGGWLDYGAHAAFHQGWAPWQQHILDEMAKGQTNPYSLVAALSIQSYHGGTLVQAEGAQIESLPGVLRQRGETNKQTLEQVLKRKNIPRIRQDVEKMQAWGIVNRLQNRWDSGVKWTATNNFLKSLEDGLGPLTSTEPAREATPQARTRMGGAALRPKLIR